MLSRNDVKELGDELVELCDHLVKAGLVDYQMGVWEEEIMEGECSVRDSMNDDGCLLRISSVKVLGKCSRRSDCLAIGKYSSFQQTWDGRGPERYFITHPNQAFCP